MKKQIISLILAALAVLLLVASCSDRGTNVPTASIDGTFGLTRVDHVFVDSTTAGPRQLLFQIQNSSSELFMKAYYPKDTSTVTIPPKWKGKKLPLVILLAPQDGDQYFYFNHGLMQLANEMIANGTIRPMLIVCVPNDHVFGGYFYGNSDPAGYYDQIIGDKLVSYLEQQVFASILIGDSAHRAIGGVGQGAYGAYRAALKHPGVFSAIAATDGPLDFDGADGNSGLITLFSQALAEQPGNSYKEFDTTRAWPISRMFVGGSLAFSPHIIQTADSFRFVFTTPQTRQTWIKILDTIPDTMTLITGCVNGQGLGSTMVNPGPGNVDWDFHLPFDQNAQPYRGPVLNDPKTDIWGRWLSNNPENMLTANALSGTKLWFATSTKAEYGFHDQTESWIATLKAAGYTGLIERPYTGDGGSTANNKYLYDVMREMLIFYSNSFGTN
jgi:hypothetical protein